MTVCPECGLPMKACSALALYRIATNALRAGRTESGIDAANCAKDMHEAYMAEWRGDAEQLHKTQK